MFRHLEKSRVVVPDFPFHPSFRNLFYFFVKTSTCTLHNYIMHERRLRKKSTLLNSPITKVHLLQKFDLHHIFKVFSAMDFYYKLYVILALFAFTLLLNLPFGYARAKTKRYSLRWFLYIHIPIPLIFIARTISHLDIKYIPIFAVAAITGQILGGKLEF